MLCNHGFSVKSNHDVLEALTDEDTKLDEVGSCLERKNYEFGVSVLLEVNSNLSPYQSSLGKIQDYRRKS